MLCNLVTLYSELKENSRGKIRPECFGVEPLIWANILLRALGKSEEHKQVLET